MMLANFFSKSKPINFILLLGLFLAYYILLSLRYDFLAHPNQFIFEFAKGLIYFTIFFFTYNFIITKNKLSKDNSYSFLLLVCFLGAIPAITFNDYRLFIHLMLLFSIRKVYSIRNRSHVYKKLFDAGLWLGLAFLIQPVAVVFAVFLYAGIFLYDKIVFRTLIIPIVGFATPVLLFFTYCFFVDKIPVFYELFTFSFSANFSLYTSSFYQITFALFLLLTLVAIFSRSGAVFSVNNRFKRSWVLLMLHLCVAVVFAALSPEKNGTELIAVYIPMSIIVANWLQFIKRKWLLESILILLISYSFAIHFII